MLLIYVIVAAAIPCCFSPTRGRCCTCSPLLFGIGLGGDYMIIPLMAADLFGVQRLGRVMGFVLTADGVAEAVSPMFVAGLRDRMGSYGPGFLLLMRLAAIGAVAVSLLPEATPARNREVHPWTDADFIRSTVIASATAGPRHAVAVGTLVASARPARRCRRPTACGSASSAPARERTQLMDACLAVPGLEVVSLCDAYTGRAERAKARSGGKAAILADYRAVLDDRNVDAVFIVTPDHWHKTMAVAALDAGKDVYIEKPMTYTVDEGTDIIAAVDRTTTHPAGRQPGREFARSCGTAREIVKSGRLGQITLVRANFNRNSAGGAWLYPIPPDASERTVNWPQFLGSAPQRPFSLERFFRWRCYWDYSGGLATDLFVHLTSEHPVPARRGGAVAGDRRRRDAPLEGHARGARHASTPCSRIRRASPSTLGCTLNSTGADEGVHIYGTKGALHLTGDEIRFSVEQPGEDNRWVVRSWPEALEARVLRRPEGPGQREPVPATADDAAGG